MTIWKYELDIVNVQSVEMPRGARILSVQIQNNAACIWALVDPEQVLSERRIIIHGTGHLSPCAADMDFVGTIQLHGGQLVFHVFDGGEAS